MRKEMIEIAANGLALDVCTSYEASDDPFLCVARRSFLIALRSK
jgi:hypothetical protein